MERTCKTMAQGFYDDLPTDFVLNFCLNSLAVVTEKSLRNTS